MNKFSEGSHSLRPLDLVTYVEEKKKKTLDHTHVLFWRLKYSIMLAFKHLGLFTWKSALDEN